MPRSRITEVVKKIQRATMIMFSSYTKIRLRRNHVLFMPSLGNSHVHFQIDSGTSANIIDENTFITIKKQNRSICLLI